ELHAATVDGTPGRPAGGSDRPGPLTPGRPASPVRGVRCMCRRIPRPTRPLALAGLALLTCLPAAGCGKRASVQGTVTYANQPVAGGRIFFLPEGEPKGRPAVHATIEGGKYGLSADKGPEVGKHRVEIVWHRKPGGKPVGKQGDPGFSTDDLVQTLPAIYN